MTVPNEGRLYVMNNGMNKVFTENLDARLWYESRLDSKGR